jgi:hypothetical protein
MTTTLRLNTNSPDEHRDTSSIGQTADQAAEYIGRKAEAATAALGGGLESLGNTLRAHTHQDDIVRDASAAVANCMEETGRYVQEKGLEGMAADVTGLIRRNPVAALLAAFGVGFLLARATTSRS